MTLRTRFDDLALISCALALMVVERAETGIVFNPMSESLRSDPYPFYERLRRVDPFHRCRNADGWVLSRYADIQAVLRDPAFSADERSHPRDAQLSARLRRGGLREVYEDDRGSMLRLDPPTHTRLRGLVSKAFSPRAIERVTSHGA
jgi:cytochrome P450